MPQVFKRSWVDRKTGERTVSKWYWLDYRIGGKRRIERTNPPTNNERLAEKQLYARLAGTAKDRDVLVSEVIDNYRSHLRTYSATTLTKKGYWLDWWKAHYGAIRASEFGHVHVRKAIDVLEKTGGRSRRGKAKPVKPGTVRGYLGLLKAAFARAADKENLIPPHTIARLEIRHQSPKRSVTFTADEIARTKSHLAPWAAKLVDVLATTGIRIGDALTLDWSSVDLQAATLTWTQQKTESDTIVPLSPAAVAAFGTRGIGLVFPDTDGKPRIYRVVLRELRDAMDAAGVRGRTPHDLRRTFAQALADEGVDDRDIAFLLGQSSTAMVKSKYTYVKVERARKALARVS